MKMNQYFNIMSVILASIALSSIQLTVSEITFDQVQQYAISSLEFREIKRSEVDYNLNNAYSFLLGNKKTSYNNNNEMFIQEVSKTWNLAFEAETALHNGKTMYAAVDLGVTSAFFPFLVCVSSNDKESGYDRMKSLSQRFSEINSQVDPSVDKWSDFGVTGKSTAGTNSPVYPMYNTAEKSCFGFNSLASEAKETAAYNGGQSKDDFFVIPFTFSMKMEFGTIEEIERRFGGEKNVFTGYSSLEQMKVKLAIQFSPGTADGSKGAANWNAEKIISVSRALANEYYQDYLDGGKRKLSNLRGSKLEAILKEYSVSYKDADSSRRLEEKMDGPCSEALAFISYEPYSLGHSFDAEISFTQSDETTKQCVLTFVRAMAQQPEVFSIAAIPVFEAFNDVAAKILLNSGRDGINPFHEMGFMGQGQVVTMSDTGLDQENCYFYDKSGPVSTNGYIDSSKRKIVQYFVGGGNGNDETGGHGTHVAGTILGEKSTDGVNGEEDAGNGIAPKAKLAVCDIGTGGSGLNPASDMKFLLEPGRIAKANIHTASWGAGSNFGGYSYYCTRFDEYLYLNQEFLVTMAAGNSGAWGISWPATAKNIVAVGATANNLDNKVTLAPFSSRGKVDGGRIKPDVVAPGMALWSAYGGTSCSKLRMQGTSMATPAVAGVAAIIRQYLVSQGINPGGSLVKSLLANSGQKISYGSAYDNNQGFGLVDLLKTLPLEGHNAFNLLVQNLEEVSEGGTNTLELIIDDTSCPLSVTMAYTDPASESILNDVDLEVEMNGKVYYPNGLNEADQYNVIERTRIDNASGKVTIRVIGSNLIQSGILYSLSVTGCFQVSGGMSGNTVLIGSGNSSPEQNEPEESEKVNGSGYSGNATDYSDNSSNVNVKNNKQDKYASSSEVVDATEQTYSTPMTTNAPVSAPTGAQAKAAKENKHL